jgi:hypothetical protein
MTVTSFNLAVRLLDPCLLEVEYLSHNCRVLCDLEANT